MRKLIYIVIACSVDGDNYYRIDSLWTSSEKAKKRVKELNSKGLDWLLENWGCGLFDIEQKNISTWQIEIMEVENDS